MPGFVSWREEMRHYLEILRTPHVGRLFAASLLARLPMGINGLAIVLIVQAETGLVRRRRRRVGRARARHRARRAAHGAADRRARAARAAVLAAGCSAGLSP